MTSTTSAASPTNTACLGSKVYDIPVQDPAVGILFGGNHTDIMKTCCKSADVISYYGDCGLYCLAIDQSVQDIINCCYKNGAPYTDVFYRGTVNASATATGTSLPTGAQASVVATGGSGKSDGMASETGKSGAERTVGVEMSTLGLSIGALLFSATTFGTFQL